MNLLEIVEIRDKLKEELAVVERFLEIAKSHGTNGKPAPGSVAATVAEITGSDERSTLGPNQRELPGTERDYGSIGNLVCEAIRLCPEKYSIRDISGVLEKINKPLTKLQIATALNRFARRGIIHVHRKGKGSKPTMYKKTVEAD